MYARRSSSFFGRTSRLSQASVPSNEPRARRIVKGVKESSEWPSPQAPGGLQPGARRRAANLCVSPRVGGQGGRRRPHPPGERSHDGGNGLGGLHPGILRSGAGPVVPRCGRARAKREAGRIEDCVLRPGRTFPPHDCGPPPAIWRTSQFSSKKYVPNQARARQPARADHRLTPSPISRGRRKQQQTYATALCVTAAVLP